MVEGWIKLYRQIQFSEIWDDREAFDKRSAWIDLLLTANYCDTETPEGTLKRGQLSTSVRKLGDRWKWSRTKVQYFLNQLETLKMISQDKDTKKTLITILNYENFQGEKATKKATKCDTKKDAKELEKYRGFGKPSDTDCDTLHHEKEPHKKKLNNNINNILPPLSPTGGEGEIPSGKFSEEINTAIGAWIKYRKEIKKPLTEISIDHLFKQIEKNLPNRGGHQISEIIYNSISQGYTGIAWTALDERRPSKVYRESPATEKKRDAFFDEFQNMIITDRRKP